MKKILIIEDNDAVRDNLEEILALSGYEVLTACDGIAGVEKAISELPDLILCDVMMPKLDGFGTLRILSQKSATSNIPFIFLTAKAEKRDMRQGMNLGADDYIVKPFDHVELLEAVSMRLEKADRLEKAFQKQPMENKTLIDESRGQKELEQLAKAKESRTFRKRDLLFLEGEMPRRVYYVAKGKVKTFKSNANGKELITGIFKKGDFMGYQALLQQSGYEESAAAMTNAEIVFIPKEDFFELLYGSRDFTARFIKMLAREVVEKEEQLLKLAYNSIRKRVADVLVDLHQKYRESGENNINILREDLGNMVGTAKESVSRMLTDFKSEKLIEIDNTGVITILNKEKLANLPN